MTNETWFGDAEIDAAMRGEELPEPTVVAALQPPKLQLIFNNPDGVRPVHQTFQGAVVDPDTDPWAGLSNNPPSGEIATTTKFGG